MIFDFFFLQVADTVTSMPCPKEGSEIIYLIGSFMGGSTLAAIVNGYFNVESTKQLLGMEADLKLAKQSEAYYMKEAGEEKEKVEQLTNKLSQLEERHTSGFTESLQQMRFELAEAKKEKEKAQREKEELIKRIQANRRGQSPPQR